VKTTFLVLGPLLALVLTSGLFGGQGTSKRRAVEPPEPGGSVCQAEGADCVFGSAGGCNAYCEPGQKAKCEGGSCILGFPRSAKCGCR
jgi:hypothetical protein